MDGLEDEAMMNAKNKEKEQHVCYPCGKAIDGEAFEYIKTKRGTEIRMHRKCVPKGNGSKWN